MYACSAAMALTMFLVSADDHAEKSALRESRETGRTPSVRFVTTPEEAASQSTQSIDATQQPDGSPRTAARYSRASYESVLDGSAAYDAPHASHTVHQMETPQHFAPASISSATTEVLPAMNHDGCNHCCPCDPCGACGRCWGWKAWKCHGGLAAWRAKHDFTPHIPYRALPAESYYFRPYNYLDIPEDQAEVVNYGRDPRMPYENLIFSEDIYEGLDEEEIPPVEGESTDGESTTNGQSPFMPVPPPDTSPEPSSESDPQSSLRPHLLNPQDEQRSVIFGTPPIPGDEPFTQNVRAEGLDSLPLSPSPPNSGAIRQTSAARYHLSDESSVRRPQNSLR
jgi:hypothetical protein